MIHVLTQWSIDGKGTTTIVFCFTLLYICLHTSQPSLCSFFQSHTFVLVCWTTWPPCWTGTASSARRERTLSPRTKRDYLMYQSWCSRISTSRSEAAPSLIPRPHVSHWKCTRCGLGMRLASTNFEWCYDIWCYDIWCCVHITTSVVVTVEILHSTPRLRLNWLDQI